MLGKLVWVGIWVTENNGPPSCRKSTCWTRTYTTPGDLQQHLSFNSIWMKTEVHARCASRDTLQNILSIYLLLKFVKTPLQITLNGKNQFLLSLKLSTLTSSRRFLGRLLNCKESNLQNNLFNYLWKSSVFRNRK